MTVDVSNRIAALSPEKRALLQRQLQQRARGGKPALLPKPRTTRQFPLSFSQERQWFLTQWDPASSLYAIVYAARFSGVLHVAMLQQALDTIVQRHEALRTTFTLINGTPHQIIATAGACPIAQLDLRDTPADQREAAAVALATAESQKPFDLAQGPLLRVTLIRLGEREHVMVATMHHIIFDGWSAGILIRELGTIIAAIQQGAPAALAPLPVQYADVAVWQREWLQGAALDEQLDYWRRQLAGPLPVLTLPTDRPYPPVKTPAGARRTRPLPPQLVADLNSFTRAHGVTLFMAMLAAWRTLLFRYTHQDDMLVGTPVAGRTLAQMEPIIGYFANTLVLRTDLSGAPSFAELLERVRATTLAAYDHQDAPFEKVVEALHPERDLGHSPLFQVMFVLQNDPITVLTTDELTVAPVTVESGTAKFALTLEATRRDDTLALVLEYKTDLFDAPTIDRLLEQYETLLASAVADPSQSITRLALLRPEQRLALLPHRAALTPAPHAPTLHAWFAAQAALTPGAAAVTFAGQQLTYAELHAQSNRVAHALRARGVGPDTLVALAVEPSIEMVVGILGILKAGGAYLPLDPANPRDRIAFVLEDAQPPVLLTQEHIAAKLPPHQAETLYLDPELRQFADQPASTPDVAVLPEHLAYVIYTSGSTGRPKGCMLTHGNVTRLFSATQHWYAFGPQDVWTLFHSFAFDFSVWELWGALLYGGRLVVVPYLTTRSPDAFYRLLVDERVTVLNQTPSAFRQLMPVDQAHQPSALVLRYVIFGGEALNLRSLRPWFERHGDARPQLVNMYGITETTVHVTYRPLCLADACEAPGSLIGVAIPDLDLYILDEHQEPVPPGVPGELYVGGAGVARGYLNRPELTEQRFIANPFATREDRRSRIEDSRNSTSPSSILDPRSSRLYRTGDLARWMPDGDIEYLGRIDTQVKVRGFRIELGEIEQVLAQHPAVREVVVLAREDTPGDQRLVAYLVLQGDQPPTFGQLRTFAKRTLPEHMVPAAFITLDAIPLTRNGKVNHQALPARSQAAAAPAPAEQPGSGTPIEQAVARIWLDLLGAAEVGPHDNFFELGGHSLLATQVITRLRELFSVELSLRDFFATPTVAGLASAIVAAQSDAPASVVAPIVPLALTGDLPLSFAQQRIWFLQQMQPDSAYYHVPVVYRLRGALRPELLEQALSEVLRRHAALRSTFHTAADGRAVQRVEAAQPLALPLHDLRGVAEEQRMAALWQLAAADIQRPFDLTADPLLRGCLVQLAQDDTVLVLSIHHIAFDEWSSGVLMRELAALYRAFGAGQPAPLLDLPVQYPDYAAWQHAWLAGGSFQRQLDYWRGKLAGAPLELAMLTDFARTGAEIHHGAHALVHVPPPLYIALNALAKGEDATLFMVLMAAWAAVLQRYSSQDEVLVGTPIANRTRSEIEDLIGFFANTLVIRNDLRGDPSFRELVRRTRETALEAYAHQDLPFDQLVAALMPERQSSRSPLFQAMLVLQNAAGASFSLPGLAIELLPVENATAKFELSLVLYDQGHELHGWFEYATDLFAEPTMRRFLAHFQTLLERVAAEPDRPLSQVELISDAEEQQLLLELPAECTAEDYVLD